LSSFAFAQESPNLPAPADEEHQRILWVIPAFGVTDLQHAPALTAKHKMALATRQAFDPFVWVSSGIQAGASHGANEFPSYGQGLSGFGKRYSATMLDSVDSELASSAFCALLKQDPRYFRLGQGSVVHRTLYSMAQQFSAKNDGGHRQFNWPNVLGMLVGASLSNIYYPPTDRGFGLTMNRFAVGFAWGVAGSLPDEFWPDVERLFHRKKDTIHE
jgi:hypothetical protein